MIPESIKKLANKVRNEIYGRDVRESIAQSMEVSGETSNEANERSKDTAGRQTDVENRFDDQIAGNTDIDEVIDARRPEGGESYPTLRKRLDDEHKEVTAQLAQTSDELENKIQPKADKHYVDLALETKRSKEVKLEPEDFSKSALQLVTGDGEINILSIPQDYSVTPKKVSGSVGLNMYPFHRKAILSDDDEQAVRIMEAIKDIRLYGANPQKGYRIERIERNRYSETHDNYTWRLSITDSDDVEVCRFYIVDNYEEPTFTTTITLSEVDGSGITGEVLIDWSKLADGEHLSDLTFNHTGLDESVYNVDLMPVIGRGKEFNELYAENSFLVENQSTMSAWLGNNNVVEFDSTENTINATVEDVTTSSFIFSYPNISKEDKLYVNFEINPFRTHFPVIRSSEFIEGENEATKGVFTNHTFYIKHLSDDNIFRIYTNGYSDEDMSVGDITQIRNIVIVNLTKTFGEGNEPSEEVFSELINRLPNKWFEKYIEPNDWQRAMASYLLKKNDFIEPVEPVNDDVYAKRTTSLQYKKEGDNEWVTIDGVAMLVPDTDRVVHTVEISGLTEDSIYEFRLIDKEIPTIYTTFNNDPSTSIVVHWHTYQPHTPNYKYDNVYSSEIHKFRTLPSTINSTMKFAQISDTHGTHDGQYNEQIFSHIGENDVRCIIHSGDIATGNGGESPDTWYAFFDAINSAIDTDGCIIPILPNLGNHEILLGSTGIQYDNENVVGIKPNFETHERGDAEWYYCFFPKFPGLQGYGVIDFGDYASVWQLDPGISTYTNQGQDTWLSDTLSQRRDIPHKFISMHYSPFPLGRRTMARAFNEPRRDFAPIYEPYKPLVLTGHEHVWGLTVPILGGSMDINEAYEDPNGVVYIGSAPAGTTHREGRNPHTKWWIEDSRASIWEKFAFEEFGYSPAIWNEEREPHEADGTTFTFEEVNNWWLIELENDKRTMTAYDLNKNEIYSFTQAV